MATTRIVLKRQDCVRRFLKFETSSDGSIIILFDLDPKPLEAPFKCVNGVITEQLDESVSAKPYGRISCHTTGVVHYYSAGARDSSFFIDPLYELSQAFLLVTFSVPRFERCDLFEANLHRQDLLEKITITNEFYERISVSIVIAPIGSQIFSNEIAVLRYEIYELKICSEPNLVELAPSIEHIVSLAPIFGKYEKPQVGKVWAELKFHQKVTGEDVNLFFENGVYTLLTSVPMRITPKLTIGFIRAGLSVEVIPFQQDAAQPTHKLKFFIKDRSGRNKKEDFRSQIESIELDARL